MCVNNSEMNPKLSLLMQSFYHVANLGSFSRASRILRQSRSTLTTHIYELESIYSIRLINRTTRSFSLSEEGEQLLDKCRELNYLLQSSNELLSNFSNNDAGGLCIKIPTVLDNKNFHTLLRKFKEKYPGVILKILVDNNVCDLVNEKVDVALHLGELQDSSYICRTITSFDTYVVASKSFWDKYDYPVHPNQLRDLPCVNYRHCKTGSKWSFIENGHVFLVDIGASHICDSDEMLMSFALDGSGITTLLDFTCSDLIAEGRLTPCLTNWTHKVKLQALFLQRENTPPRVRNFLDTLVDLAPLLKP